MYHESQVSLIRSPEERQSILDSTGSQIYIKVTLTNIKRDPKCNQNATWSEKISFFEKVRVTGKELCELEEWSNAKSLYARCLGLFKNVTRT